MQRRKVTISVAGKLNLSLNVTGRQGGMHTLDSVVCSVNLFDTVTVCERFDGVLNVEFAAAPECGADYARALKDIPQDNSVTRAVRSVTGGDGVFGADIVITKRLPYAGGMGGSSADAAGAIAAVETLLDASLTRLTRQYTAAQLGSDIAYMQRGGYCRLTGIGDEIEFFDCGTTLSFVLTRAGQGVHSCLCYNRFDALYPGGSHAPANNGKLIDALKKGDIRAAHTQMKNALFEPARTLEPKLNEAVSALEQAGASRVFMTGSGNVCAGAFSSLDACDRAAARLRAGGLWAQSVFTLPKGIYAGGEHP